MAVEKAKRAPSGMAAGRENLMTTGTVFRGGFLTNFSGNAEPQLGA